MTNQPTDQHEDNQTPFSGLTWNIIRDILGAPKSIHSLALRTACTLIDESKQKATVMYVAKKLKTNELAIFEIVSHLPSLFRLGAGTHTITMINTSTDLNYKSPRQIAEETKAQEKQRKIQAEQSRLLALDMEETPLNQLRVRLNKMGLENNDARSFARLLATTYSPEAAAKAISVAEKNKPANPKTYIIGVLRSTLRTHSIREVTLIKMNTKPTGENTTHFIGWTEEIPRQKLFRLPDGRLKIEPPPPGEIPPSTDENPGCRIVP